MPQHVTSARVDFAPLDLGHQSGAPVHAIQLGATRDSRNVVFVDGEVACYPGEVRLYQDPVDGTFDVLGIGQYFRPPYLTGDPVVIVTRRKVQLYLVESNVLVDITPTTWTPTSWPPQFEVANDGSLVVTNGEQPWIFKTELADSPTAPPKMRELGGLRVLGVDDEPLIDVRKAFAVGKLGPYLLLGRVNDAGTWVPNRWHYSDINNAERWFTGFAPDEEGQEGAQPSVAGFDDLPSFRGHEIPHILGFTNLREFTHLWENHSVWNLQQTGIPGIPIAKRLIHPGFGLLTHDSIASDGDRDYVWAKDGLIYEFNGLDRQEISAPIRHDMMRLVNSAARRVYAYIKNRPREVVFAFVSTGNSDLDAPDLAWCFNLENRSWSLRHHPFTAAASLDRTGVLTAAQEPAPVTWATITGTWAEQTATWDELGNGLRNTGLAMIDVEVLGSDDSRIYRRGGWLTRDNESRTFYWTSAVTDFGDGNVVKHLTALEIDLAPEGSFAHESQVPETSYNVEVVIKASDDPGVDWAALAAAQTLQFVMNTGQQQKLDCRVTGRYFQIRVQSTSTPSENAPTWETITGTWAEQTLTWAELGEVGRTERPWVLRKLVAHVLPRGLR